MEEHLTTLQRVLDEVIAFLVAYGFRILGAVIVLIVGFKLGEWLRKRLMSLCQAKAVDPIIAKFTAGIAKLTVIAFTITVALSSFGVTIAPIIAAVGALAFGGAFAVQGVLANFFAGLSISLGRPFKVGDTITVQGVHGVVEEVKLPVTVLSTEDGERIRIPNKHIVGEILVNSAQYKIVEGVVGISYSDDPKRAIEVLRGVLATFPEIAQTPPAQIGIREFGDSSVNLGLRYWVPTKKFYQLSYAVNLAVFQALREAKITIPFPQRDVHLSQAG